MPDLDYRDDSDDLFCAPDADYRDTVPPMIARPEPEPNMSVMPEPEPNMSVMPVTPDVASAQADTFQNWCEAPASAPAATPAPPAVGLDSYEVVPDDFVGPLAPNQIRQSQRDNLDHYNFGNFNVVPDDFVGPLTNDQMRQSDYQSMQSAWLNISDGQGMNITGSDADQETFRQMLRNGMTDSPTFRNMISSIGNDSDPAHTIQADVGRSQPGVIGDSFATNAIDLDDLEAWPSQSPEAHPNQFTRNEAMVHFLTERQSALASANPADFGPAHQAGIDAQNQYRTERGQAQVLSQTGSRNADGSITATVAMEGGINETWDIDNNQSITNVTPP